MSRDLKHRYVSSSNEESRAQFDTERDARLKHFEGVSEAHHELMRHFVDGMKDGETMVLHYGPHVFALTKGPINV